MSIGHFTFQDDATPGKVFIQIKGEGGLFNWSDVPDAVKTVMIFRSMGLAVPVEKEQAAIAAMAEFWKKHF